MVGTVTIGAAYPALYAVATHAVIAPYALPDAYVDLLYDVTLSVVGAPWDGPTVWELVGTLPGCIRWDPLTATFRGRPMRVGVTTLTVRATDAIGRVLTRTYTL